jgi:acetyl esterase/lipase
MAAPKARPPRLTPNRTFIYKVVPSHNLHDIFIRVPANPIKVDIFVPPSPPATKLSIFLFIHGGGWIHSNRSDYGRAWFEHFLARNYVVCSMDYRFLPESTFEEQCSDVRDIEPWLHTGLQRELSKEGFEAGIDKSRIIVAGASAGAHLALLTVNQDKFTHARI